MAASSNSSSKFNDRKKSNPIYQKLSDLNRDLSDLTEEGLRQKLRDLKLDDRGSQNIIHKRYKQHVRDYIIKSDPDPPPELSKGLEHNPKGFKYLVIVDFEATCEKPNPPDYVHEIIEFPALLFNIDELKVEDQFHSYCRPVLNPKLSEFCLELTGIEQATVDHARPFKDVFQSFSDWISSKELGTLHNFTIATDCPWDIKHCLFPQCALSGVLFPDYATKWVDIRKLFSAFYQIQGNNNLNAMLGHLQMVFQGREHCGLDDSRNIARIITQLLQDGCTLQYNRFIRQDVVDSIFRGKS